MSVQPQKHSLPSHQLPSKPVPTSPRPSGSQAWGRAGRRLPEKWGRVGYKCPRRTRPWTQISWVGWVPLAVLVSQKGRLRARRIPQERPRPHPGLAEARNLHAPNASWGSQAPGDPRICWSLGCDAAPKLTLCIPSSLGTHCRRSPKVPWVPKGLMAGRLAIWVDMIFSGSAKGF